MGLFSSLLSLFPSGQKTPKEDFTSEILVGVLGQNQALLDRFVNDVLKVAGDSYSIQTRKRYRRANGRAIVPDVIIKNNEHLIFLENKVHASEGEDQLLSYRDVLVEMGKQRRREVHLRYCTKFLDEKDVEGVDFAQIRWFDVARFLSETGTANQSSLIDEFVAFLEEESMARLSGFTIEDLAAMVRFANVLQLMEQVLSDDVEKEILSLFGSPKKGTPEFGTQLKRFNRFARWVNGIIGNGDSEVLVAFRFERLEPSAAIPMLNAQIWLRDTNDVCQQVREAAENRGDFTRISSPGDGQLTLRYETPLVDYVGREDQVNAIQEWFLSSLRKIDGFRRASRDELPWK